MIRPKLLLLCTTLMLGSCQLLTPQPTSITIYNQIERPKRVVKTPKVVTCHSGGTYIIPDKPSLDDLVEGDDQGVVDRLNAHIDLLRADLKKLARKQTCTK
jgi:hypothetical protein